MTPALVIAQSVSAPENKNENQIVEQIQKNIEIERPVLLEFPRGEQLVEPKVHSTQFTVNYPIIPDGSAKMFIYLHESGNNPYAVNPTSGACGLAQALPCSKMGCALGDYACQDAWATRYAISRYGGWEQARQFWLVHKWW